MSRAPDDIYLWILYSRGGNFGEAYLCFYCAGKPSGRMKRCVRWWGDILTLLYAPGLAGWVGVPHIHPCIARSGEEGGRGGGRSPQSSHVMSYHTMPCHDGTPPCHTIRYDAIRYIPPSPPPFPGSCTARHDTTRHGANHSILCHHATFTTSSSSFLL